MALELLVLASGSRGNATVVRNAETGEGVLVDCGICKRDFLVRCSSVGMDPARLAAILVTHEHTDHTKGLGGVTRGLAKAGVSVPLYVSDTVRAASPEVQKLEDAVELLPLAPGVPLNLAGMRVLPFATSHDAASSCGFRFECDGDAAGFLTDSGVVTDEAHAALEGVRLLGIEANHDVRMLEEGPYPWPVKRRIASERGHLSNDQAAEEVERIARTSPCLAQVAALHVSQHNNTYRLAADALRTALDRAGRGEVRAVAAYQDRPIALC